MVGCILLESDYIRATVIPWGAALVRLETKDRDGVWKNIILSLESEADYEQGNPRYFGAVVGRWANRIKNGEYTLDGKQVQVEKNEDGVSHLHGGKCGFSHRQWTVKSVEKGRSVCMGLISKDGDEGFPGTLVVQVTYTVDGEHLRLDYEAALEPGGGCTGTPVNLTNHAYFNLTGSGGSKPVDGHTVQVHAARYLPVDASLIPTGDLKAVDGSLFDLRDGVRLSKCGPDGFDHCFCLNGTDELVGSGCAQELVEAARLVEPESGRWVRVLTTLPGIQVYTSKQMRDGICLETQYFPDSVNQPAFPKGFIVRHNAPHKSSTVFQFGTSCR